jgi:glycosyltransferase involved in cell wall biosynthesis
VENKNGEIICFTSSYPYGDKETYFENELQYLAKEFKTVYIQPTYNPYKTDAKRKLPPNVVILKTPLVPANKKLRLLQGILNASPMLMFLKDFFANKAYRSRLTIIEWANALLVFRISYNKVEKLLAGFDNQVVLYHYWATAYIFATKLCEPYKKVVRMHGGDFYLYRHNGYLPLRSSIYKSANVLAPISNDISSALEKNYRIDKSKIYTSYLGVFNNSEYCAIEQTEVIRIASCSHLFHYKRVHLIAEALLQWNSDTKIEWHHFGNGPELEKIQSIISRIKGNVSVVLHGAVAQATLYDFYKNNYVTWFLNMSVFEGVPVSIMEAFSFGIPVIATNVGATAEIVNSSNGYLLGAKFCADDILELLLSDKHSYLTKRVNAYNTWSRKFNAETNYTELVQRIKFLL